MESMGKPVYVVIGMATPKPRAYGPLKTDAENRGRRRAERIVIEAA
jgi:hypothetical protein